MLFELPNAQTRLCPIHWLAGAEFSSPAPVSTSQVVKQGDTFAFEQPNPFAEPGEQVGSVGYRYRKWNLGDDVTLVVRCEADAFNRTPKNEMQFATIKALNEYDSKATGVDWRQKLDSQKGAVLATELKNNSNKLAKWTMAAILNGSDTMTLGYARLFGRNGKAVASKNARSIAMCEMV